MDPARLQEIILPLETMLNQHDFHIDDDPRVNGPFRMASFVRMDGVKVDYVLNVKNDFDLDTQPSGSDIRLQVDLYKETETISLYPNIASFSDMPAPDNVNYIVDNIIKPNLEQNL